MTKGRMEAFSDGVLAIIITIMVLELKVPHGAEWATLRPLLPIFISYVLSFVLIGTYWNNHHHMLHAARQVNGPVLWANMHLLFWLSLMPFATGWMGENEFATLPVALYGFVQLMAAVAYYFLSRALVSLHGPQSPLAEALGRDRKGLISLLAYLAAVPLAFVNAWISFGIFVLVALMWFIPDRRIEEVLPR